MERWRGGEAERQRGREREAGAVKPSFGEAVVGPWVALASSALSSGLADGTRSSRSFLFSLFCLTRSFFLSFLPSFLAPLSL